MILNENEFGKIITHIKNHYTSALLTKRHVQTVLHGQVFQANVNGRTKSIVATDQRQRDLLEGLTSRQVALLAAALVELKNAILQVTNKFPDVSWFTLSNPDIYLKTMLFFSTDPTSCNRFQHCFDRVAHKKTCPGGLVWDTFKNKCGWPGEV